MISARFADSGEAVSVGGKLLVLGGESKALREQLDAPFTSPRRGLAEVVDAAHSNLDSVQLPVGAWAAVGVHDKLMGGETVFVGAVAAHDVDSGLFLLRGSKRATFSALGPGSIWLRPVAPPAAAAAGGGGGGGGSSAPAAVLALMCRDCLPASFPLAPGSGVLADCGEGVLRPGVTVGAFDTAAGEYTVALDALASPALPARRVVAGLRSLALSAKGLANFARLGRSREAGGAPEARAGAPAAPRDPRKAIAALAAWKKQTAARAVDVDRDLVPVKIARASMASE